MRGMTRLEISFLFEVGIQDSKWNEPFITELIFAASVSTRSIFLVEARGVTAPTLVILHQE